LVKYNAERIWQRLPEGVDLDDLISAGVFGLMDAIDAFDLSRGVKFETYCVPRIRGAMLDELRTMDWVPRLVRSKHSKMEEARKALEAQHGRPPTDAELAERLGVPLEEYEKMAMDANAVGLISLNKKWYETDSYKDVREIDILEDKKGEDPTRGWGSPGRALSRGLPRPAKTDGPRYSSSSSPKSFFGVSMTLFFRRSRSSRIIFCLGVSNFAGSGMGWVAGGCGWTFGGSVF